MAASGDAWLREYNEAARISEDTTNMISERSSVPAFGQEAQRHVSDIRRKIHILQTRLDSLQSLLAELPSLTQREMNRRMGLVFKLRTRVDQMASMMNMSKFGSRDSLLGPEVKSPDAVTRIAGLDNQGVVGLQRQVIKEQDEDLEQLEVTIISTKHIALAVNEELDLQKGLLEKIDQDVDFTNSKLQQIRRRLAILNKRTKGGCSCINMLLSVIGIVVLVVVIYMLFKYL